ncbi:MAG: hypothetical protein KC561_06150 [Myxococcales bacterium]|nr:hypothetical protein [Myxococcales bacterium]
MRPPICDICGADALDNGGGLVRFALRPSDQRWLDRAEADPDFVGHPPNQEWYCGEHIEAARALDQLAIDEATAKLRDQY